MLLLAGSFATAGHNENKFCGRVGSVPEEEDAYRLVQCNSDLSDDYGSSLD